MKRATTVGMALVLAMASGAGAAEFQPVGALGIGGAGVARTYDAYAPYWNPAGLAFPRQSFSSRLNAGAGMQINSTMVENVDRLGKLDITELRDINLTVTGPLTQPQIDQNRAFMNKAVQFTAVLDDLNHHDGTLMVTADAALGFQYGNFAVGGFTTGELAALPNTDTTRVKPGGTASLAELALGLGANQNPARTGSFFTTTQYNSLVARFGGDAQAQQIVNTLELQLAASNPTKTTNDQAAAALTHMADSFAVPGGANSLENNQTTLEYLGLILIDIPISYGHQLDLGSMGKLGIGGSLKIMQGRAFIGESQIVKVNSSGDIVKNITDHYKDTTNVGIDLGLLWRYADLLNVGIVAKNLNSPEFDTPQISSLNRGTVQKSIRVKPQVRTGVAITPLSWLTLAADLDLTENETVLVGRNIRHLGGGFELHPLTWLKFRGGMYDNLANDEIGPVGTLGLTFGSKWFNLDLDGAAAFKSGTYKEHDYPREMRVQLAFNMFF